MQPFYERATKDRDVQAGTLCVKILERRALLLGLDQPTQSRVDVYQVEAQQAPSSYDTIHAAIMGLVEQASPAEKALRKRLEQVSAERALELLGPLQLNGGNGDAGAVDALSDLDVYRTKAIDVSDIKCLRAFLSRGNALEDPLRLRLELHRDPRVCRAGDGWH